MAAPHPPPAGGHFLPRPNDIFAFCNCAVCVNAAKNRSATTDLSVINDYKPPQIRYPIVVIYKESSTCLNCESANFVSLQLFASVALALQCRRIHDALD